MIRSSSDDYIFIGPDKVLSESITKLLGSTKFLSFKSDEPMQVDIFFGGEIGEGYEMDDFINDGAEVLSEKITVGCILISAPKRYGT
jgi:hypothetical protein